ncbi:MAG: IS110 family transposase [Gammaproteobacteria bacterium]
MNYCGIDLASKASAICVMDEMGAILREDEIPTDADGFRTRLGGVEAMKCVVEASPLAEWAVQTLEGLGHEAVIIDARRAKAVVCTKKKTDRVNARDLANMARTGWYTAVHRKTETARELRTWLTARAGLVETSNALNARIRGLLRAHGIKLGNVAEREFEMKVQAQVKEHLPNLATAFTPLLELWRQAIDAAEALRKEIAAQTKQDAVCQRLMSVPGVGPLTAAAYVATIDDPQRFKRSDQVGAYVGLVPSVYQSGDIDYRGRVTKEGDRLLRWLLVEAAHNLLSHTRRDCALKRWGEKLEAHKGTGKARVAVARKLAVILHRLWITGGTFDWQRA